MGTNTPKPIRIGKPNVMGGAGAVVENVQSSECKRSGNSPISKHVEQKVHGDGEKRIPINIGNRGSVFLGRKDKFFLMLGLVAAFNVVRNILLVWIFITGMARLISWDILAFSESSELRGYWQR
jgi:hypothetical protein